MIQHVMLMTMILSLALSSARVVWGQEESVEERLQRLEQQAMQQRGRRLYRQTCAPCHGVRGDGQGPAARGLQPRPHDFTRGLYKFRTTPFDAMPTDADLFRTISEGIPGTPMPAWKRLLSESQRQALVHYIKTFAAEKFAAASAPVQPLRLPPAPPASPERIAQGQQIYDRLQCWQCHGRSGGGDGPLAAALPIPPQNFTRGVYKSGLQPEDLLRTVLTGLAGTPMASFASAMSLEEGWNLVHYVRSLARPKNLWYYLMVDTGEFYPGR